MEKFVVKEGDKEKKLDETIYKKDKDGKFTPEAMGLYLYKKNTGQSLETKVKENQPSQNPKGHLAKH